MQISPKQQIAVELQSASDQFNEISGSIQRLHQQNSDTARNVSVDVPGSADSQEFGSEAKEISALRAKLAAQARNVGGTSGSTSDPLTAAAKDAADISRKIGDNHQKLSDFVRNIVP